MEISCSSNNLAIIIVTYNPDNNLEALLNRCQLFSGEIYVVDNNSNNIEYINSITYKYNCTLISLNANTGIGYAINTALRKIDNNKKWVLTFDQDSLPVKNLLYYYNEVINKNHNIGLIGINYKSTNIYSDLIVNYSESLDQITSGLLHNLEAIYKVGYYNEMLFIDCVDFEYSLRMNSYGFKTITISNCLMKHSIGNPKTIRMRNFQIRSMNHNAFRQYYIIRNHIWLAKKYFTKFPVYIICKFYHLLIRLIKTILIDDDKKNKVIAICKGLRDGIRESI